MWSSIIRSIVWTLANILLIMFIDSLRLEEWIKQTLSVGLITQNILHALVCFLDPGTIFEDEEETYVTWRVYCMTCCLYRLRTSKHCLWCNRCVKKYDHHCSVFGKCIGKRNLIPFWAFIAISAVQGPLLVVIIIIHIASNWKITMITIF